MLHGVTEVRTEIEVVLLPENHKEKFSAYVSSRLKGEEVNYQFNTLKAKSVNISWDGTHVHVDDKVVKLGKAEKVKIELRKAYWNSWFQSILLTVQIAIIQP